MLKTLVNPVMIFVWSQLDALRFLRCEEEIIDDGRVEGTMIYLPPEVENFGTQKLRSEVGGISIGTKQWYEFIRIPWLIMIVQKNVQKFCEN